MRSLLLTASATAFILCGLVPAGTRMTAAGNVPAVRSSLFAGNPIGETTRLHAEALIKNVLQSPVAEQVAAVVERGAVPAPSASTVLGAVLDAGEEAIAPSGPSVVPTAATTEMPAPQDSSLQRVFQKITWAKDKGDVRLCEAAVSEAGSAGTTVRPGDILALCIATVNREAARCAQIASDDLKNYCSSRLAS